MGKTRSKFITFIVVFSMLLSMGVSFGADLSSNVFSASEIYFHGNDFLIEGSTNSLSTIPAFWFDNSGDMIIAFSIHHTKNPSQVELNGIPADGYKTFSTSDSAIKVNSNTFLADDYTSDSSPHKWLVADFGEVSIEDLKEQFSLYVNLGAGGHNIGDNGSISIIIIGEELEIINYTGVYDGAAHSIEVTNIIAGDTVSYSDDGGVAWTTTNPTFTDVGEYTVDVKVENSDYEDRTGEGTVTITPKPVTITVNDGSKLFGEDDPVFDGTFEGLVDNTDLGTISYKRTNSSEAVGVYPNVLDAEYTENSNYDVEVIKGDFEIKAVAGSVLDITNYNEVYDGGPHSITVNGIDESEYTIEYSLTNDGTDWTETLPLFTDVTEETTVYVKVTRTGYEDRTGEGTVTITPKELTITADDKSKSFGEADPDFTASFDGFVNGENETDLTGEIGFTRQSGEDVGIYDITPSGLNSDNYNIVYVDGQLVINSTDGEALVVEGYEGIYDGQYHSVTINNLMDDEIVEFSTDNENWSSDNPEFREVGNYKVYVRAMSDNYDTRYGNADVIITPRPITITAASSSRTFNGQPLTNGNYSITSGSIAENDELLDVTVTGTQTNVGSSANIPSDAIIIAFGEVDANENYEVTYVDGTLTVTEQETPTPPGPSSTTYTVTFEDFDGTLIKRDRVNPGRDANPPGDPTRTGFEFKGWEGNWRNVRKNEIVTATYDEIIEIDEPITEAPPVVITPLVTPPEVVEVPVEVPAAAPPQAPTTLPKAGSVGAGEMAGFGALLMAIGILLGKKKGF